VYQFTRVPFGFRKSLASFTRALQQVLGENSVAEAHADEEEKCPFLVHLETLKMEQTSSPETFVSYQKRRRVKTKKTLYNITTAAEAFNHIVKRCCKASSQHTKRNIP
jgi:hypothetical protein